MFLVSLLAPWLYWPLLLISLFVLRAMYRKYLHPLCNVPGPFLAPTTNLWRLAVFLRGRQHHEYLALFQKYGPLVRIGPNSVILNDQTHFAEFFGYDKSPWWKAFRGRIRDFNHGFITSMKDHAKAKSQVMGGYTMSNVLKSEEEVDRHVSELMKQFSAKCGTIFDIAPWTQWAAFDIAMDVAFSNPLGFIKSGSDVGGLIGSLHELLTGAGSIALFPSIVNFMQQSWVFPFIAPRTTDKRGPGAIYGLAWSQLNRRFEGKDTGRHSDILQWLIDHENRNGERLSRGRLEEESVAPVIAGSDTAATVLRAIVLFLSTNRRVLDKLRREIDNADEAGVLSTPPKYKELTQHVPYIAAIMKESLRLYPVLGSPIFRETPKDGATISGHYLPPCTEIGICQYAVGRNTAIFGEDADRFRPERWTEEVDAATRKLREAGDVSFGHGAMKCSGRNVAMLQVWKIATQVFRQFEIEVVDPVQPWQEKNSLIILNWDFKVRFELREKTTTHVPLVS